MSDVIAFWREILNAVAEFLLLDPISYFTAIFILLTIVALVRRIVRSI